MDCTAQPTFNGVKAKHKAKSLHGCVIITRVIQDKVAHALLKAKLFDDLGNVLRNSLACMTLIDGRDRQEYLLLLAEGIKEMCKHAVKAKEITSSL